MIAILHRWRSTGSSPKDVAQQGRKASYCTRRSVAGTTSISALTTWGHCSVHGTGDCESAWSQLSELEAAYVSFFGIVMTLPRKRVQVGGVEVVCMGCVFEIRHIVVVAICHVVVVVLKFGSKCSIARVVPIFYLRALVLACFSGTSQPYGRAESGLKPGLTISVKSE